MVMLSYDEFWFNGLGDAHCKEEERAEKDSVK